MYIADINLYFSLQVVDGEPRRGQHVHRNRAEPYKLSEFTNKQLQNSDDMLAAHGRQTNWKWPQMCNVVAYQPCKATVQFPCWVGGGSWNECQQDGRYQTKPVIVSNWLTSCIDIYDPNQNVQ